ncbi:hypothetical protein [Streptomyces sp. CT34]|uniref:hypothetical protein n=1 Tax=Streptomyces sp. CT34 TaxID=1553907 RepID=UPI00068E6D54|nr:hypothetical protein [Streptomyces sp. CT34]
MDAGDNGQVKGEGEDKDQGDERPDRSDRPLPEPDAEPEPGVESGGEGADDAFEDGERERAGLTPRQARRVRVVLASVMMALMAALLVVRLASRTSVLVVGVYGAALILCGVVIELSRHGRTRLGTWLLGVGLTAAVAADWLLLP